MEYVLGSSAGQGSVYFPSVEQKHVTLYSDFFKITQTEITEV